MGKNKSRCGSDKFHDYYQGLYGERWPSLIDAMKEKPRHIVLVNPFADDEHDFKEWLPHAYHFEEVMEPAQEGPLAPYYFMDGASYLAPYALAPKPGDDVLDLCAAPGGKSLVLAYLMQGQGRLIANDKSTDRRFRLQRVLRQYLPQGFLEAGVKVTGFDASGWCLYEQEAYDKILLDAPCSSERHVLNSEKHLNEWSEKRSKRLAALQWKMLASAWIVLKKGGRLVYSTCSLSHWENEGVVAKLIKKYPVDVISSEFPGGEKLEHGSIFLPDSSGYGPFYLAILEKPYQ